MIRLDQFVRIAVVGTSCSGKTTLARTLSEWLSVPQIELDLLHWGPNWKPNPASDFRAAVDRATAQPRWICDGNYSAVRDLVWQRASAIVWLNIHFPSFSAARCDGLWAAVFAARPYSPETASRFVFLFSAAIRFFSGSRGHIGAINTNFHCCSSNRNMPICALWSCAARQIWIASCWMLHKSAARRTLLGKCDNTAGQRCRPSGCPVKIKPLLPTQSLSV